MTATHDDGEPAYRFESGREVVVNPEAHPNMMPSFRAKVLWRCGCLCSEDGHPLYRLRWHACGQEVEGEFCEGVLGPVQ
jgi:hypothetical protein